MPQTKQEETIINGDIVRLKSGGPDMIVEVANVPYGWFLCSWRIGEIRRLEPFKAETLHKVKSLAIANN